MGRPQKRSVLDRIEGSDRDLYEERKAQARADFERAVEVETRRDSNTGTSNRIVRKAAQRMLRSIGTIDTEGINWKRRNACKNNFKKFCKSYLPRVFKLPWAKFHERIIEKVESTFLQGGMYSIALPRGSGKTSICRAAVIWGTAYAHRSFPFIVGAKQDKAIQTLEFIKTCWCKSPELVQDFPEISHSIVQADGVSAQLRWQLYRDFPTYSKWGSSEIRYACLSMSEDEVKDYPKGFVYKLDNGLYGTKNAGAIIRVEGITGSIRGEAEGHPLTLEVIRPDVVLLDDVQRDQTIDSPTTFARMEALIDGAVAGLSGPGELIAALMPCTVIKEEDIADLYLDRQRKPEWRGERTGMVISWPKGVTDEEIVIAEDTPESAQLWSEYADIRRESLQANDDISEATRFYRRNRRKMDQGFEVSWKERFYGEKKYNGNQEISAKQHAMNLRLQNPITFCSEYQNRPRSLASASPRLDPKDVANKITNIPQGVCPQETKFLVGFVDVQNECLFYLMCAVGIDYTGMIVDYGVYPPVPGKATNYSKAQMNSRKGLSRAYFKTYEDATGKSKTQAPFEGKIYYGLQVLVSSLTNQAFPGIKHVIPPRKYKREDGTPVEVTKLAIDARWGDASATVKKFTRDLRDVRVLPYFGQYIGASSRAFNEYQMKKDSLFEHQMHPELEDCKWFIKPGETGRYQMLADANKLKTFLMNRLAAPLGVPGSLSLYKASENHHSLLAHHLTRSEYPEAVTAKGRTIDEWKIMPSRPDNDFLDCASGCMALASWCGAKVPKVRTTLTKGEGTSSSSIRRKRKLSHLWNEKMGR